MGKYLHKEAYLNAALDIVQELGAHQLTMRRVADYLAVSHMAVYKHFASKEELLTATLDAFIERTDVLPDEKEHLTWEAWVSCVAQRMHDALCHQSSWLPLLGSINVGAAAMKVTQNFLARLQAAGFSAENALRAYLSMLHMVIGAATLESALRREGKSLNQGIPPLPGREVYTTGSQLASSLPILIEGLQSLTGPTSVPR